MRLTRFVDFGGIWEGEKTGFRIIQKGARRLSGGNLEDCRGEIQGERPEAAGGLWAGNERERRKGKGWGSAYQRRIWLGFGGL